MSYELQHVPSDEPLPTRHSEVKFTPFILSLEALRNGMRWLGAPGSGKTRGIALTMVWPHLWHGLPAIVVDPIGALCAFVLNKVTYFDENTQRRLWPHIRYVDMAATDFVMPFPLLTQQRNETLFAAANRFPEVLKRLDPDLTSAPILGWNSLFECGIYAGQIAVALGRQLDFVAELIAQPQRYKDDLRQALAHHPELERAVTYFRQLMDPNSKSLRERRTGSLMTKLVPFLTDPLLLATFSAHRPGMDWAEEMRQGHTVLLDFGGETDRERRQFKLVWSFLEIVEFLKSRGPAGRTHPILLVIDEVSALLGPRIHDHSILGDDLNELLTVFARNFGIKLCIANQYPSQLGPVANQALLQLGTQVIGNVQHPDDALDLARQFHFFNPSLVRKVEPVWMNVQEVVGRELYSTPRVIDERTIEFTADEQFLMAADAIRRLPKFHFLVRPALTEGNLTGVLRRVSMERLDQGLYPDDTIVAEVRKRLRKRDGVAVTTLLDEMAARPRQGPEETPRQGNAILKGDNTHAQVPRSLPTEKPSKPQRKNRSGRHSQHKQ